MTSEKNILNNELIQKNLDISLQQFSRIDRRFKINLEYIQESNDEDSGKNFIIESSCNDIKIAVKENKKIELFGLVNVIGNFTTNKIDVSNIHASDISASGNIYVTDISASGNIDVSGNLLVSGNIDASNIGNNNDETGNTLWGKINQVTNLLGSFCEVSNTYKNNPCPAIDNYSWLFKNNGGSDSEEYGPGYHLGYPVDPEYWQPFSSWDVSNNNNIYHNNNSDAIFTVDSTGITCNKNGMYKVYCHMYFVTYLRNESIAIKITNDLSATTSNYTTSYQYDDNNKLKNNIQKHCKVSFARADFANWYAPPNTANVTSSQPVTVTGATLASVESLAIALRDAKSNMENYKSDLITIVEDETYELINDKDLTPSDFIILYNDNYSANDFTSLDNLNERASDVISSEVYVKSLQSQMINVTTTNMSSWSIVPNSFNGELTQIMNVSSGETIRVFLANVGSSQEKKLSAPPGHSILRVEYLGDY